MHACTHAWHARTHARTHACTCTRTHVHTYTRAHMHRHKQAMGSQLTVAACTCRYGALLAAKSISAHHLLHVSWRRMVLVACHTACGDASYIPHCCTACCTVFHTACCTAFRTAFRTAFHTACRTAFHTACCTAFHTAFRTAFHTACRTARRTDTQSRCDNRSDWWNRRQERLERTSV